MTGARGTFREAWALRWEPEFAVRLIEASGWGPTVELAAVARVRKRADASTDLAELTGLLEQSMLAELPDAVRTVLVAFEASAAVSSDIPALMSGVPALARAARYGSVRRTDAEAVAEVLRELLVRVTVGLPAAAAAVDDDAAGALLTRVDDVHAALGTLADEALSRDWNAALARAMDRSDAHPLLAGRCARMLRDGGLLDTGEVAARMGRALSRATPPLEAGAWLEGFLTGSGLALIHDAALLALVDAWVADAGEDGVHHRRADPAAHVRDVRRAGAAADRRARPHAAAGRRTHRRGGRRRGPRRRARARSSCPVLAAILELSAMSVPKTSGCAAGG